MLETRPLLGDDSRTRPRLEGCPALDDMYSSATGVLQLV